MIAYLIIGLKLALGLLSITFVINISGKGNLAPSSASDQIQNYVLGGIIGGVIYNPGITLLQYFIILLLWSFLVLALKWIKTNNHFLKKMIDGEPVILIKKGIIDVEGCRRAGLTAQEISFKLRNQNVYSVNKVKQAILEQNGQLIVVQYGEESTKFPLITDATIQKNVLDIIDKSEEWLLDELTKQGYELREVFLCEYEKEQLFITTY